MINKIITYFKKVDPQLYSTYKKIPPLLLIKPKDDHFVSLVGSIINQQLSGKVADVIYDRLIKLLPNGKLTPQAILALEDESIRKIGISYSKIKYIKDLSTKTLAKEINFKKISLLDNEKVIEELTKVKGIGRWTAEMFLMFTLAREDIFSHGDLGLRRAIERIYNVNDPSHEFVEKITRIWSPYRTYACMILWQSLEKQKDANQKKQMV